MEFYFNRNIVSIGTLEVITGSMFSGKSEELIRRLRRAEYARQKIVVFSPSIDNRYGENGIYSHGKESFSAYSVISVADMEEIMSKNIDVEVIGIDEVQFLGEEVVEFCKKYVEYGKRVIVAGLDMSFRAEPYHPVPELMSIADRVDKFNAICTVCGKPAYASQRLIDGEPAYYDDPLVMVGASENYEARCRRHHVVRYREEGKGKIFFLVGTEIDAGKKEVEKFYMDSLFKGGRSETIILDSYIKNSGCSSSQKGMYAVKDDIEEENMSATGLGIRLQELRERIRESVLMNDCVFVRIIGGLLLPLEGGYSILDFICEYRKKAEIIVVSKNRKGLLNHVLLVLDLLKKSDLNINKVFYRNSDENEGEKIEIIEKIKEITGFEYLIL